MKVLFNNGFEEQVGTNSILTDLRYFYLFCLLIIKAIHDYENFKQYRHEGFKSDSLSRLGWELRLSLKLSSAMSAVP